VTKLKTYTKLKPNIIQKVTIGDYCLKNSNKSQNREKSLHLEPKYVKFNFLAFLGASGLKKKMRFYEFGGMGNVMELFGNIE